MDIALTDLRRPPFSSPVLQMAKIHTGFGVPARRFQLVSLAPAEPGRVFMAVPARAARAVAAGALLDSAMTCTLHIHSFTSFRLLSRSLIYTRSGIKFGKENV